MDKLDYSMTNEMTLVILTLKTYFNSATDGDIESYLKDVHIDWNLFYDTVRAHQIGPIISKVLSRLDIPREVKEKFHEFCLISSAKNLRKISDTSRIVSLCESNSIKVAAYKGVPLAALLFDDFNLRESADIDFLVAESDYLRLKKLLVEAGYQTKPLLRERWEKFCLKHESERKFWKSEKIEEIMLEIHWKIVHPRLDISLSNELLLSDLQEREIFGRPIPQMNAQMTLVSLLCHHGVNDAWQIIKHFVDIAAALDKLNEQIDWKDLISVLKKSKFYKASAIGIIIANDLLLGGKYQFTFPKSFYKISHTVKRAVFRYPTMSYELFDITHFKIHLHMRDSLQDKFMFVAKCVKMLFIPNVNDFKALQLKDEYFFLYYLIKPLRLLTNLLRKWQPLKLLHLVSVKCADDAL